MAITTELICPHCGATFSTQEELSAHIRIVHPLVQVGGWINELQNLLAGITDLLGAWGGVVHPEGVTCPYCGATFSTQEELKAHVLSVHPTAATGVGIGEWMRKNWPWLAVGGTGTAIVTTLLLVKKKKEV